jgi:P-type conjugative transfer protein TrbG
VLGYTVLTIGLLGLLLGCTKEEPLPPVPPPPEDLSNWSVPELVQPEIQTAMPQPLKDDKPTAAEHVYDFVPGNTYGISVSTNKPIDIVLDYNEQIRNIVGGDQAPSETAPSLAQGEVRATVPSEAPSSQGRRWEVKEGASGLGDTLRSHIFVAVSQAGLTTGVIVTTTKRTYLLDLKSVRTSPVRVVRWTYPQETPVAPLKAKEPGLLPDPQEPRQYHVGYSLEGTKPHWQPRQIVDDGKKTYIIYPEVTLFESVPMLRLIGPNGPQLVNARQYLNVVIVDQLVARGELRVGIGEHAETVTITRGQLRTIACPGDPDCPHWPQAAQVLARKGAQP